MIAWWSDGVDTDFINFFFSKNLIEISSAPFTDPDSLKYSLKNFCDLVDILGVHFLEEILNDAPAIGFEILISGYDLTISFYRIVIKLFDFGFAKNNIFKESFDFLHWEIIGISWKLVKEIDIFVEYQSKFWFQDLIDQIFHMLFFKDVRHLLEKLVQGYSRFIISFLSHLV